MSARVARHVILAFLVFLSFAISTASAKQSPQDQAKRILDTTGIKGGLVVHIGSADGKLTAALRANDSYLVHGLATKASDVGKAQSHIASLGLSGPISIAPLQGNNLPYIDNLVNLIVAEDLGNVPMTEVMRVLAPRGIACVREGGKWTQTRKPRPPEIDEWTHYRHDATGNPVAHDEVVGPPRHMQWVGSPRWSRHHDHMASLSAMVSAGGRIFYIIDEGPKASIQLPPKWVLVARDAFNGTVLWKRPIANWYNHLYPLKSGPSLLTRRLVANADRVYVTLGINAPLSELDAATGQTLRTFPETTTAEEVLYANGMLLLNVNPNRKPDDYRQENAHCWTERDRASARWGWDETPSHLIAIDVVTGARAWHKQRPVMPLTLAADGNRVVFHDGKSVVCLDQTTGDEKWQTEPIQRRKIIPTGFSPTVVLHDGVVLVSTAQRQLVALSGDTGKQLWGSRMHPSGHFCPEDVIVMDGLVWSGDIASGWNRSKGMFTGRDPHTGDIRKEFKPDIDPHAVMHQRCYPSKATDKFLMPSWIGIEFIDPEAQHWQIHHWVRGSCIYGVMPCNGLTYATPHSCACYYQSKLSGFAALAPTPPTQDRLPTSDAGRLEEGPAYVDIASPFASAAEAAWPTYRNDNRRSGFTKNRVPTGLSPTWTTQIGGKLTSLTTADGKLYVAAVDQHTLYALDTAAGQKLWHYTTGGRIDSPPTIYRGHVLFGSADGWVYCLRAADGALAWRFRAAPAERYHVAYEQVESVWPVHGSVLIRDDVLYCVAGRSMFLDGGLRLLRLDPRTGRKLSETVLDDKDPRTGQNLQTLITRKKMPVALPDVLSADDRHVYMRSQRFDFEGRRALIEPEPQTDQDGSQHLFSPIGFLDDTWFHRAYWIYGKNAGEGWGEWFIPGRLVPSGRLLVFDDNAVYGYARLPEYLCNSSVLEYRLFSSTKQVIPQRVKQLKRAKQDTVNWKARATELTPHQLSAVGCQWLSEQPPLLVRAMVLADKTLFVAGPPDIVDEKDAWGRFLDPEVRAKLDEQAAALDGNRGATLMAVNAADGSKLADLKLNAMPVFDGMIAAAGNLYLATTDGAVTCLAAPQYAANPSP